MVSVDEAVIARHKTHGSQFEILVDPDLALSFRRGEEVDLEKILAVEDVFEDASTGHRPPEEDLENAYGTTDVLAIARQILQKGDLQLTAEQRRQLLEEKRRKVIQKIARHAINPQTNGPHPPKRIERAMEESGVSIEMQESVDENVQRVLTAIRPLIPIRFEEVEIAVKVPPEYAGSSYGEIMNFGELVKEEWMNDGSWIGVVKIPAGLQNDFYGLVNSLTKGEAETKLLKESI